jgi:hypothetical protein
MMFMGLIVIQDVQQVRAIGQSEYVGGQSEASEMLAIMIEGRRLRDIADLPLDLAT